MFSVELGSFLVGATGIITAATVAVRQHRHERRIDKWVAADAEEARAKETVEGVVEEHENYRRVTTEERNRLEEALAAARAQQDELRSQLVKLRAKLAEKQIELAAQIRECARLEHRVDQLIGTGDYPTVDARPPHLNRDEED